MRPLIASSLFLVACSSSPLDPGAGNNLGSGTQTLSVEGSISADSDVANASNASGFTTHFEIHLTKGGQAVTTGTVTISSNGGDVALTFDGGNGNWIGSQAGYFEVYGLDVTSGSDAITGVRIDGPDLHTFTAPALGATLDSTMTNTVTWSRDDHADIATLRTNQLDRITIDDTGTYSLAPGSLKSSKDKAENESIELRRTNQVQPAGAVPGSTVGVTVRNHVDVVVQINPAA
jgi:hypothetical protein